MRKSTLTLTAAAALMAALALVPGCSDGRVLPAYTVQTGGAPGHGRALIVDKNCGACHTIPGIGGANGTVGPPLYFFSRRTMIAGVLPNTPQNLIHWIRSPESVVPANAMPNLGLTEQQARDVAAYLYTLR